MILDRARDRARSVDDTFQIKLLALQLDIGVFERIDAASNILERQGLCPIRSCSY